MSVRTRDWIKFGTLVAIAFVFGLAFASALNLPKRGEATAPALALQTPTRTPLPAAAKPVADLSGAFVAVADHVRPAVVFVRSEHRARGEAGRLPPGFEDFFPQFRRPPQVAQGTGPGFHPPPDGDILTNNTVVSVADRLPARLYHK